MWAIRIFVTIVVATFAFCNTAVGAPAIQLTETDFVVAGVAIGAEPASVRKALGQPKGVATHPYPNDPTSNYAIWKYSGLLVHMGADELVFGLTLTTNRFTTNRGLKVGDSKEKLLKLYGRPTGTYQTDWDYELPSNDLEVMRVTIRNHKITKIFVGWLSD